MSSSFHTAHPGNHHHGDRRHGHHDTSFPNIKDFHVLSVQSILDILTGKRAACTNEQEALAQSLSTQSKWTELEELLHAYPTLTEGRMIDAIKGNIVLNCVELYHFSQSDVLKETWEKLRIENNKASKLCMM